MRDKLTQQKPKNEEADVIKKDQKTYQPTEKEIDEQLEIFADDVKCSHGCTVGQLNEDALFYMQQRGIPIKEAKGLLMYAFANEALVSIKIPVLKQRITKLIAEKLGVNLGFDL